MEGKMKDRLLLSLFYLLPKHALSKAVGRWARSPISRYAIPLFIRRFRVNLEEAEKPWRDYPNLLEFFVRRLKPDARPVDPSPDTVVSPVDGVITQLGEITEGTLIQSKGVTYRLVDLLGGDREQADRYDGGKFLTIYLSPRDYHRIHTPVDGEVTHVSYIPGQLFPVNAFGLRAIRRLFVRNERLITFLRTALGTIAVVKVGATNVGSIRLNFDPQVFTRSADRRCKCKAYEPPLPLSKGEEMGRFEFGSTVILLFEPGRVEWISDWAPGTALKMGQPIIRGVGPSNR
ncbi:MAG: archaetidylserine decarboxylase [Planifilum sp.]